MSYPKGRPTLPDHIGADRLPDDTPVLVTKLVAGHTGATHLFEGCESITEETDTRETTLADNRASREAICSHCLGEDGAAEGPAGHWQDLADPETTDLPGLEGRGLPDEDPDDRLITDGGRDVELDQTPSRDVQLAVGADVPRTAADGGVEIVDHSSEDDDGDVAGDAPECEYGECEGAAWAAYSVATPTGSLRMAACRDHAPAHARPVEVFDRD